MSKGADLSHWNTVANWDKVKVDFVILKCTEATSYKDPTFEKYREEARKRGMLVGAYHFARGGDATKEADYFVKNVGAMKPGELLVLDWEIDHPTTVAWCKRFLDRVSDKVGFRPLIYLNGSTVNRLDWTPVINGNYGLWIARYYLNTGYVGLIEPSSGKWPFWVMWQYTSRGKLEGVLGNVDLNTSKVSIEVLKKYGKPAVECKHCCPAHCV